MKSVAAIIICNMQLIGHNYKYAVEQIALSLFQSDLPEFISELRKLPGGGMEAITTIGEHIRSSPVAVFSDINEQVKAIQRALKLSFYHAAVEVIGNSPPWGAVSGVKPTRLVLNGVDLERDFFVSSERAELCRSTAKYAVTAKNSLEPRDVVLYVGIPFCPTRCSYCSFVSQSVEKSLKLIEPYLDALLLEISATAKLIKERNEKIRAVYIGGGTPTTLSANQLSRLIENLYDKFELSAITEFTVEAGRPDTIDWEKLRVLKSSAVTRVSVNPQTLNDSVLNHIGRRHAVDDFFRAYSIVRELDFDCVNVDFIAGLPTETLESFQSGIEKALTMNPENITLHTLARKRGSSFNEHGDTSYSSGETVGSMLDFAFSLLRSNSYSPYYLYRQKFTIGGYENTGWTLPGKESLYNICMMEELCGVYALGAGGSTKLLSPDGKIERSFNPKYPQEYIKEKLL